MAQKPSIPKGTRDFSPTEMVRRSYIIDSIKEVFRLYGYQPIETPAIENLSTLLGKYGDEGDKLLYKIRSNKSLYSQIGIEKEKKLRQIYDYWLPQQSEMALRYDLTVPFARYVVQHRNDITFPFKRYQIQPVWRADRPQRGRYREFFQCDVDVIGSKSLLNEVELVQIINDVFSRLRINCTIKINNRKVLAGIVEYIGEIEKFTSITVAIDKLDKIGIDNVKQELSLVGVSEKAIRQLSSILDFEGDMNENVVYLGKFFESVEIGKEGINEVKKVLSYLDGLNLSSKVEFDLTLARGLNYYTGAIIEVVASDVQIGSICGGGRYDDLTGIFGLPDVSGVGVSFGADRIYDVMLEKNLFPEGAQETTQVMFVNFGEKEQKYCLPLTHQLRSSGINAELFPEPAKLKKQMNYANNKNIPFVVLVGDNEMKGNYLTVKNMNSGEQKQMSLEEIISQF